ILAALEKMANNKKLTKEEIFTKSLLIVGLIDISEYQKQMIAKKC
ncbi:44089_t:CDS:1, partial [Gigaspora margarita]